jgi:TldD protein
MKTQGVNFVNSFMSFVNEQKFYASTDGSRIEQYIVRANPSFTVTAVNRANGDFQSRSALGGPQTMGYEYIEKYDW